MKKYFYNIMFAFIGALAFTACSEESGTEPGTGSVWFHRFDTGRNF